MNRPISLSRLPDTLNQNDIAMIMGVDSKTVISMCKSGELPMRKLGRNYYWSKQGYQIFTSGEQFELVTLIKELQEEILTLKTSTPNKVTKKPKHRNPRPKKRSI